MSSSFVEEKDISLRVATLRTKKDVSARDMSLSIGQNPGYINNIESGKSMPSIMGLIYICEYLGISPSEFFDFDSTNPAKLRPIVEDMKKLNDEQLQALATIVKDMANK